MVHGKVPWQGGCAKLVTSPFLDVFLLKLSYETVVTDVTTRDHELLI